MTYTHSIKVGSPCSLKSLLSIAKILYIFLHRVRVMVFNATFNNISVILWQSVLMLDDIRVPEEQICHKSLAALSHNVESVHLAMNGIHTHNFSQIVVNPATIRPRRPLALIISNWDLNYKDVRHSVFYMKIDL